MQVCIYAAQPRSATHLHAMPAESPGQRGVLHQAIHEPHPAADALDDMSDEELERQSRQVLHELRRLRAAYQRLQLAPQLSAVPQPAPAALAEQPGCQQPVAAAGQGCSRQAPMMRSPAGAAPLWRAEDRVTAPRQHIPAAAHIQAAPAGSSLDKPAFGAMRGRQGCDVPSVHARGPPAAGSERDGLATPAPAAALRITPQVCTQALQPQQQQDAGDAQNSADGQAGFAHFVRGLAQSDSDEAPLEAQKAAAQARQCGEPAATAAAAAQAAATATPESSTGSTSSDSASMDEDAGACRAFAAADAAPIGANEESFLLWLALQELRRRGWAAGQSGEAKLAAGALLDDRYEIEEESYQGGQGFVQVRGLPPCHPCQRASHCYCAPLMRALAVVITLFVPSGGTELPSSLPRLTTNACMPDKARVAFA